MDMELVVHEACQRHSIKTRRRDPWHLKSCYSMLSQKHHDILSFYDFSMGKPLRKPIT